MTKVSTLQYSLLHFWVSFLLVVSFFYANSAAATEISGNEEFAKTSLEVHDEEAKFKGFVHIKPLVKKPFFKKPIPNVKPIPKPYPLVKKPIPVLLNKPISKLIPIVKPIPKSFGVKKPIPS
ncbi:hypothetical protein Lal_00029441 [Lupinus albus]|uniref:Uncharacterized protein n=1 Tax=Lupinus albus TaxID=3870 RepID=A0A6A5NQL6_LUPAL|nr:hypothetical protein Lalb_Chr19g0132311 [Lupinus albus]KAF1885552.1 hypothetical protein Lal_00029441 [Lupinus albus]